jgi:hypothetical protein
MNPHNELIAGSTEREARLRQVSGRRIGPCVNAEERESHE